MIPPGPGYGSFRSHQEEAVMSRTKNARKAHRLIDQAAVQATTIVDQAAGQASALVDQVAPHLEAARERVATEYAPQAREAGRKARKAGRKARKQMMEQYAPQARAAFDDARDVVTTAATTAAATAAAKSPIGPKPKKKRGRTVLKLAVLAGIGTAVGQYLRNRNVSPASMYEAPTPQAAPTPASSAIPPQPGPSLDVDPVPPGAVGEHNPEPEDLSRLENEAPVTPATTTEVPDESLNSFFDEVMDESRKGSRRR